MNLHLLIHSVLMHVSAAMIILIYIPLSIPVKLFMWAFVKPFRKEDLRGKVVLITGASSGIGEELAYQYAKKGACLALVARRKQALEDVAAAARERGSPDVLVLPADVTDPDQSRLAVEETVAHFGKLNHLVASRGLVHLPLRRSHQHNCLHQDDGKPIKLITHNKNSRLENEKRIVSNSIRYHALQDVNFWGSVYPTYYALPHLKASKGKLLATKAAQLRFYETLRAEVGSEVGVTILTPGFVESEMTKGKVIRKGGDLAVDEEARDVQIGVFPVGRVETLCEVALDAIRKGDWYVTWPSLYRPVPLVALLAPEVFDWLSHAMYDAKEGARPLSQRMLEATRAKRLFPSSLRHHPDIKTEKSDRNEVASSNV
ncbi:hypothetical protein EJB05_21555 [Eragrostis curvula]|uniref:Uncharacterized protein n=1 Tax=Eragrostis curvula TaxID=38414 RepID=A0A5J9V3J6_9POAL|nr:hypothetical protein EJB05_21555 [Eragrostis curvula]